MRDLLLFQNIYLTSPDQISKSDFQIFNAAILGETGNRKLLFLPFKYLSFLQSKFGFLVVSNFVLVTSKVWLAGCWRELNTSQL